MKTAFVLIDLQKGFDHPVWGNRNHPQLGETVELLLARFRTRRWPIVHVQHLSQDTNSPLRGDGAAFMDFATPAPGEPVVTKSVHSAFIGTHLEAMLRADGITTLVLAGFTSDHCVSTTARMAADLGFEVLIPSDAVATFDRTGVDGTTYRAEHVHAVSLASLNREFALIASAREILKNLEENSL